MVLPGSKELDMGPDLGHHSPSGVAICQAKHHHIVYWSMQNNGHDKMIKIIGALSIHLVLPKASFVINLDLQGQFD